MNVIGTVWRHYKGPRYQILEMARHTELTDSFNVTSLDKGLADLVIYKQLEASQGYPAGFVWARPYNMFFDKLEYGGKLVNRFTQVSE